MSRKLLISLVLLLLMVMGACSTDHYKPMQHKWRMITEEATLELNSDSTFIFMQHSTLSSGKWKLEDNGNTIVFKQKGKGEKKMEVKQVSGTRLILSDNGDDQDYIKAD